MCTRILSSLFVLGLVGTALAAPTDGVWTGAADGFFTNANNWAAGMVPGRYLARDAEGHLVTNGEKGATITLGDQLTGNKVTTIDFDGVYSMTNLTVTATQNRYTLGTSANQYIPIESCGTFNGGATAGTLTPNIVAKIRVGVECYTTGYGTDFIIFRNDSSEELALGGFGALTQTYVNGKWIGGNEFKLKFYGSGDLRFRESYSASNPHVEDYLTGTLYLDATLPFRNFNFKHASSADYNKTRRIVIGKNGNLKNNAGFYASLANNGSQPVEVSGEGMFTQSSGGNAAANYNPHVKSGMFNCYSRMTINTKMALTESRPSGYEGVVLGLWITGGAGPLVLNVPENGSTVKGLFRFTSSNKDAVLEIPRIGKRGTYGAHGDEDFSFCNNGILRYTGPGETMDRNIAITNQLAQNADTAKTYPASGTLEQAGTGEWRVESAVALTGPSAGTLTFKNDTAFDGVYAGTMAGAVAVNKTGSGRWKFDSATGYTGATTVSEGELCITKNGAIATSSGITLAGGTKLVFEGDAETPLAQTCPALTVTDLNTILEVKRGCTVTLNALTLNGTLDVQTEDDTAVFKVTGRTGDAPSALTINGETASFAADGTLKKFTVSVTSTTHVHGGVVPNDSTAALGIIDGGTDGNVTLAADETTVASIVQQATDAATVEIGSARALTVNTLSIDTGKGDFNIGTTADAGTLKAGSNILTLWPEDAAAKIAVNATLDLAAATEGINVLGAGTVTFAKAFDYSKTISMEGGTLAVTPAGTTQNFALAGAGTFVKEGGGAWTANTASPLFTGDYVVRGGTVQPGALNAKTLFGTSGDLVLTNAATLKLFGGKDGTPDYGEKRLRTAKDAIIDIDVAHSQGLSTKPFRQLKMDGNLVITGSVVNSSKDTFLVGLKDGVRGVADLGGHTILKNGYGRFGFGDTDFISGGKIILPETPGFSGQGCGNILMLSGSITQRADAPVSIFTSTGVTVVVSEMHTPVPFDWTITGTSYFGTWRRTTRYPLTDNNWGGTINVTNADSQLQFHPYSDAWGQLVVSGKITGLGSVASGSANSKHAGRYYLAAPTNDYQGTSYFGFSDGSGSFGAVGFARSTSLPNYSKATFNSYGGACLAISGDGGADTSWPLTEVGRLMREATFKQNAYAGLDLANTGDFTMNLSDLGDAPAADKVTGFGRYSYFPDDYVLTVNLDKTWNTPQMTVGATTGTLRLRGADHPLTIDTLRITGECEFSTGRVEVVNGAELRAANVNAGMHDRATSFLRVGDGGAIYGTSGADSSASITLSSCTYARGIMDVQDGGTVHANFTIGSGDNGYGGGVYQSGGTVIMDSGSNNHLGSRSMGYWSLAGGTVNVGGDSTFKMSQYTNVASMLHIAGGELAFTGRRAAAFFGGAQLGHSHVLITSGKMRFEGTTAGRAMEYPYSSLSSHDSTGVITLDGDTALLAVTNTQHMFLANQTNGLAIINLNAGTLQVSNIWACASAYPGSATYLNFNGGTLKANGNTANWVQGVTRMEVGANGAVIDTAGYDATLKLPLVKPAGKGVAAVEWSYAKPVEIPYFVRIVGDGTGAAAVVEYDRATKLMTGIRVVSQGSGYTWAKARITSGQTTIHKYGEKFEVDCTLTADTPASGRLVKKGAGTLTLTGANTYTGDTVVEAGLLKLDNAAALPEKGNIVLMGGGVSFTSNEAIPSTLDVTLTAAQLADHKNKFVLLECPNGLPETLPTFHYTDQEPYGSWHVCREDNRLVLRYVKGTHLYFR